MRSKCIWSDKTKTLVIPGTAHHLVNIKPAVQFWWQHHRNGFLGAGVMNSAVQQAGKGPKRTEMGLKLKNPT